jgi:signal transduction histidine kinase
VSGTRYERRNDERRLMELGRNLVAELDLQTVLEQLLEIARDITHARYVALGILDDDGQGFAGLLTLGMDEETRERIGRLPVGEGLLGELVHKPRPLRLSRIADHVRSSGFPPGHPPMASFLGVPIHIRGRAYGNLYLTEKEDGEFDAADEDAVVSLAGWAAIAIDNARLYREEARRRQELEQAARRYEAMTEIARAVGGVTQLDRVLSVVVERARGLVDARLAVVTLIDGEELVVSAISGIDADHTIGLRFPRSGTVSAQAIRLADAVHLHDAPSAVHSELLKRLAPRDGLFVPLTFRGRPLGVLSVFDRLSGGPAFSDEDALVVEGIAASAATGVATAQGVAEHALRRSLRAAESERHRWARELHDQTLQDLAGLRLMFDALADMDDREEMKTVIERARTRLRDAIDQLRHLVAELRPLVLDDLGVGPALSALADQVAASSGAAISVHVDLAHERGAASSRLSAEVEEATYRVVQESLNNAVKHSGAQAISVSVTEREDQVVVEVSDDGIGFDPDARYAGFGLIGMRERVQLVGGTLRLEAPPRGGATVRATIPVARAGFDAPSPQRP